MADKEKEKEEEIEDDLDEEGIDDEQTDGNEKTYTAKRMQKSSFTRTKSPPQKPDLCKGMKTTRKEPVTPAESK